MRGTVVLSLRVRWRDAAAAARCADNNNNDGAPAAMELEGGPRAAGASGQGGDRATGSDSNAPGSQLDGTTV